MGKRLGLPCPPAAAQELGIPGTLTAAAVAPAGEVEDPAVKVLGAAGRGAGDTGTVCADTVEAAVVSHEALPDLAEKQGAGGWVGEVSLALTSPN